MPNMFVSNLPAVTIALNAASQKALIAAADVGRNKTIKNISGTRSGRTYKVPGTSVSYTASAPGEFPAIQTGQLRGNVDRKVLQGAVLVGTNVEHGLFLEKKPPSRGGRPWLKRSLDEAKPAMLAKLSQRWF